MNHENHPKPVTRRQFISAGLTAAGGVLLAPTLYGFLMRSQARAAGIADPLTAPAFITFDLAGGAALPGNFLVGGTGGAEDLLPSYSSLGWNPRTSGYDTRFGLPMAKAEVSKIFAGLTTTASAEAQAHFRMGSILHTGQDDSNANPLSILNLIAMSGNMGSQIGLPIGSQQTSSGGNSAATLPNPSYAPRYIQNLDDLIKANAVSDNLLNLGTPLNAKLFSLVRKLSLSQATRALNQPMNSPEISQMTGVFNDALEKATSMSTLDPRSDAGVAKIYNINPDTSKLDETALRAGLVYGAVTGKTGPAVITIGGCDYHDGNSVRGDRIDLEIGQEIGRAIEVAKLFNRPLFIHVITDGGIASDPDTRNWRGDSGARSMSVIGYYDPKKVPEYRDPKRVQVGAYTSGQGADTTTFFGANPSLASAIAFANYLSVMNRVDDFPLYANRLIEPGPLHSTLIF